MKIKPLLIIFAVATCLFAAYLSFNKRTSQQLPPVPQQEAEPTQGVDDSLNLVYVPEGWKNYSDNTLKFRINYPGNFETGKNGDYSVLITPKSESPGQGTPEFVYVSVAHKGVSNETGVIYNYDPAVLQKLKNLKVNESASVTENPLLDSWYTYKRLEDKIISDVNSMQFVNLNPWEFPSGTKETRYVLEKDGTTYLIGGYFKTAGDYLNEEIFKEIVNSFAITTSGSEILE